MADTAYVRIGVMTHKEFKEYQRTHPNEKFDYYYQYDHRQRKMPNRHLFCTFYLLTSQPQCGIIVRGLIGPARIATARFPDLDPHMHFFCDF